MSRHPLARDIAVLLVAKVLLLAGLFFAFFGPETRLHVTPDRMSEHVGIRR